MFGIKFHPLITQNNQRILIPTVQLDWDFATDLELKYCKHSYQWLMVSWLQNPFKRKTYERFVNTENICFFYFM